MTPMRARALAEGLELLVAPGLTARPADAVLDGPLPFPLAAQGLEHLDEQGAVERALRAAAVIARFDGPAQPAARGTDDVLLVALAAAEEVVDAPDLAALGRSAAEEAGDAAVAEPLEPKRRLPPRALEGVELDDQADPEQVC